MEPHELTYPKNKFLRGACVVVFAAFLLQCGHVTNAAGSASAGTGSVTPAANATTAYADPSAQPCAPPNADAAQESAGFGSAPGDPYLSQRYVESLHRPVVIEDQPAIPAAYTPEPPVENVAPENVAPRPYVSRRRTYYSTAHVRRHHKRSKGKSAAIVLGSAAAGAGIGALAGGGKGAAIGAAGAGTAGFIYDRLTHNR